MFLTNHRYINNKSKLLFYTKKITFERFRSQMSLSNLNLVKSDTKTLHVFLINLSDNFQCGFFVVNFFYKSHNLLCESYA